MSNRLASMVHEEGPQDTNVLRAELDKARHERDRLLQQIDRATLTRAVEAELAKTLKSEAVANTAAVILSEVRRGPTGDYVFGDYAAVGSPADMVSHYLATDGSWLMQSSARLGSESEKTSDSKHKTVAWDIGKAVNDLGYDQRWQQADPKGHAAAWKAEIARRAADPFGRKAAAGR